MLHRTAYYPLKRGLWPSGAACQLSKRVRASFNGDLGMTYCQNYPFIPTEYGFTWFGIKSIFILEFVGFGPNVHSTLYTERLPCGKHIMMCVHHPMQMPPYLKKL